MAIGYTQLGNLFEDWNDIVRELNGGSFGGTISSYPHSTANESGYKIEVPLIGISKEELNLDMELVRGTKYITITADPKNKTTWVRSYKMSYPLEDDADIQNVEAKLENGLLTVKIPKIKPEKKVVNVKVN